MTSTKQKITAMTNFGHSPLSQAKNPLCVGGWICVSLQSQI